jgi:putative DNA primase/helicase
MERIQMSNHKMALKLATELGWPVFPTNLDKSPRTKNGFHNATTNEDRINSWWRKWPDAGIGVPTGEVSGFVVLDIDLDKPGTEESFATIIRDKGQLDDSVASRTGGGGLHILFKHPGHRVPNAQGLLGLIGIDVRGDGGYIVVPPSNHPSGNSYQWEEGKSPFESELPECPEWIFNRTKTNGFSFEGKIDAGQRNATLASVGGLLRSFGLDEEAMLLVLIQQNETRCDPPLTPKEVEAIARTMSTYPPRRNTSDSEYDEDVNHALRTYLDFDRTDTGFAELIASVNAGTLHYNVNKQAWMVWEGYWWASDDSGLITQKAIEAARLLRESARTLEDDDDQIEVRKYALKIQNKSKIDSAIAICKTLPHVSTKEEEWDTKPFLVGVHNGVVDLTTGEILNGDPSDKISLHLHVDYVPDAKAPRWSRFLDEIFEGDEQVINFIQRAVGYSLTSDISEQCLFLLVGGGANGKSVFLQTLRTMFGSYGTVTPFTTFLRQTLGASSSNDIAGLSGKRFVIGSEANQSSTFDEGRIKSITGGEAISARFLHQEFFEFTPICKIWLGVNHLPNVRDDSDGFWRRVKQVTFPRQFTEEDRDPHLSEKLLEELPGILSWAVDGAMMWLEDGLQTPSSVQRSVQQYRDRSDALAPWVKTCSRGPEYKMTIEDAFSLYKTWAERSRLQSFETLSIRNFHSKMERQFTLAEMEGRKYYIGLEGAPENNVSFVVKNVTSEKRSRRSRKSSKRQK